MGVALGRKMFSPHLFSTVIVSGTDAYTGTNIDKAQYNFLEVYSRLESGVVVKKSSGFI